MLRELPSDHRAQFERRLQKEMHGTERIPRRYLAIAASVMLVFGLGYLATYQPVEYIQENQQAGEIRLEEYSPELKKIENYYLTAISLELASLEVTDENKAILDTYLGKLDHLSKEYDALSKQLVQGELDEALINSLIDNLQKRLQLMVQLKNELKNIKTNNNEEYQA